MRRIVILLGGLVLISAFLAAGAQAAHGTLANVAWDGRGLDSEDCETLEPGQIHWILGAGGATITEVTLVIDGVDHGSPDSDQSRAKHWFTEGDPHEITDAHAGITAGIPHSRHGFSNVHLVISGFCPDEPEPERIEVCELATGEIITIDEEDFDEELHGSVDDPACEPDEPREREREPDGDAVRLVKFWFDADGDLVSKPEGDWTVTLSVGNETMVILNEDLSSGWASISGNYSVAESNIPNGWTNADCDGLALPDISTDYSTNSGLGDFSLDDDDVAHAVCNQAEPPTITPGVVIVDEPDEEDDRPVPTRIDAGESGLLPTTGTSTLLLLLFGVVISGIGLVALAKR